MGNCNVISLKDIEMTRFCIWLLWLL